MKSDLDAGQAEKDKLRSELALSRLNTPIISAPPVIMTSPAMGESTEIQQAEAEVAALKERLASMEEQRQYEEQQALVASQSEVVEELPIPAIDPDTEKRLKRRARQVTSAMLMGQVTDYSEVDGFVVLRVINPNNVVEGVMLAIRRNTGIVGQLEVSRVEGSEAVADVLAHTFLAGEVDIQSGDELILPPQ